LSVDLKTFFRLGIVENAGQSSLPECIKLAQAQASEIGGEEATLSNTIITCAREIGWGDTL
jgi:hypothetical protein